LAHAIGEVLPAVQYDPRPQASHAVVPGDGWYSPAAHATHALSPPAAAKEPGAHAIGLLDRARQYPPASHATHDDCAADGWYSPATQLTHATPSGDTLPGSQAARSTAPLAHA
jgi:hypothetical protein